MNDIAESQGHWLGSWNAARTDWVLNKWNAVEDSLPEGMTLQIAVVIWDTHRYFQQQKHQVPLDEPLRIEAHVVPWKDSPLADSHCFGVEGRRSWRGYLIRCGLGEADHEFADGGIEILSLVVVVVVVEREDLARQRAGKNVVKE